MTRSTAYPTWWTLGSVDATGLTPIDNLVTAAYFARVSDEPTARVSRPFLVPSAQVLGVGLEVRAGGEVVVVEAEVEMVRL